VADDLSAALDAFERPGTVLYSTPQYPAVPIESVPDPEPAEPWHNEPAPVEKPMSTAPMTVTRVEISAPEVVYRPEAPKPTRKTPDEMDWRECWIRIGKLYARGFMDGAQYHDLIEASKGSGAPSVELLDKVRMALWAFESVNEERDRGRTNDSAKYRRGDSGAGITHQRLREHDAAR
jgi:hypothetical protein